jgi:membrane protein implicated in regulation of membrane protease activity
MEAALLWVVAAALLALAEIFTLTLVLGLVAPAALLAALVAALGGGIALQLGAFTAGSLAMLLGVRPIARRHSRSTPLYRGNVNALPGSRAVVLERVTSDGGLVRIGGDVWSARSFDEGQVMEPGESVLVFDITGATALVHP